MNQRKNWKRFMGRCLERRMSSGDVAEKELETSYGRMSGKKNRDFGGRISGKVKKTGFRKFQKGDRRTYCYGTYHTRGQCCGIRRTEM